jgi:hypothetical protein
MKLTDKLIWLWLAIVLSLSARAFVTNNIPISQLPLTTNVLDTAYFPLIQPYPGRTTNDTFRASTADIFKGRGTISATNIYVINLYATNIYSTNLFITNIVLNGWGLVITNGSPSAPPAIPTVPTLWIDTTTSQSWVWDTVGLVWVPINPSLNTGLFAVPTVAELRLITPNAFSTWATTWGNLAPGDGQGRNYWWNAADLNPDDGISVIMPLSYAPITPGRWNEQ